MEKSYSMFNKSYNSESVCDVLVENSCDLFEENYISKTMGHPMETSKFFQKKKSYCSESV